MDSSSSKSSSLSSLAHQFFVLGNNNARLNLEHQVQLLKSHQDGLTMALNLIFTTSLPTTYPATKITSTNSSFAALPSDFPLPTHYIFDTQHKTLQSDLYIDPSLEQQPFFVFVVLGVLQDAVWKYTYSSIQLRQQFFLGILTLLFSSPRLSFPSFVIEKATSLLADLCLCEWAHRLSSPFDWLIPLSSSSMYFREVFTLAACLAQKCNALDSTYLLSKEMKILEQQWPLSSVLLETWVCEWIPRLLQPSSTLFPTSTMEPYLSPVSPTFQPSKIIEVGLSIFQLSPHPPSSNAIHWVYQLCHPQSGVSAVAFETYHAWLSKPTLPSTSFHLLLESIVNLLSQPSVYFTSNEADSGIQAWSHLVHPLMHQHLSRFTPTMLQTWVNLLLPYIQASSPEEIVVEIDLLADFFLNQSLDSTSSSALLLAASNPLFDHFLNLLQQSQYESTLSSQYIRVLSKLTEAFPQHYRQVLFPLFDASLTHLSSAEDPVAFENVLKSLLMCFQLISPLMESDPTMCASILQACAHVPDLLLSHFQLPLVREVIGSFFTFLSKVNPALYPKSLPSLVQTALHQSDSLALHASRLVVQSIPSSSVLTSHLFPSLSASHSLLPDYMLVVFQESPKRAGELLSTLITMSASHDLLNVLKSLTFILAASQPTSNALETCVQTSGLLTQLPLFTKTFKKNNELSVLVDVFVGLLNKKVKSTFPCIFSCTLLLQGHVRLFGQCIQALLENRAITSKELNGVAESVLQMLRTHSMSLNPDLAHIVNVVLFHSTPFWLNQEPSPTFLSLLESLFQFIQTKELELVRTALKGIHDLHIHWKLFQKDLWKYRLYSTSLPILLRLLVQTDLHLLLDDLAKVLQQILENSSIETFSNWNDLLLSWMCSNVSGNEAMVEWMKTILVEDIEKLKELSSFDLNLRALARDLKCILNST